jgi:hypothetical protein
MKKLLVSTMLLIFLGSVGFFTASTFLKTKDTPIVEICPKGGSKDDWYNCLNAYFLSISEMGNKPEVGIAELERRMRGDDDLEFKGACHEITHVLGEESYKKIGMEAALAADLYQCIGGYAHGVFWTEAQDKSNPDQWSVSKLQKWCDKNRVIGSLPWEYCVHGSGHSAFIHEYDGKSKGTLSAIKVCEQETERVNLKLDRCLDGVFMAWAVYASLYSQGPKQYDPNQYGGFDFEPGDKVYSMLEFCERVKDYNKDYFNLCIEWRSRQVGLDHLPEYTGKELCKFTDSETQRACFRRLVAYSIPDITKSCEGAPDKETFKECYKNRARLDFERNVSADKLISNCIKDNGNSFCEDITSALRKDQEGVNDLVRKFNNNFPKLRLNND